MGEKTESEDTDEEKTSGIGEVMVKKYGRGPLASNDKQYPCPTVFIGFSDLKLGSNSKGDQFLLWEKLYTSVLSCL